MSNGDEIIKNKAFLYDRMMSPRTAEEVANKALVTRYVEAVNQLDMDMLDALVDPSYVDHDSLPGQEPGIEGLKKAYQMFSDPFPDIYYIFDDIIAEGDLVVGRGIITATHKGEFFGVPATGKKVAWTGTRLFRLKNNMLTEGWFNLDMLSLMQQMGVVPTPPDAQAGPVTPPEKITGAPSTPEANRALMERFIDEVWNKGNLDVADEVFHPQATSPSAPQLPPGAEGVKMIAGMFRSAFPDYWMKITHLVAEGDRVAARFTQGGTHKGDLMGIAATGKEVSWTEIGILRIADGKVVESWYEVDMMGMMQQLGVGG